MVFHFQAWNASHDDMKLDAEQFFGCCGFADYKEGVNCTEVVECGKNATDPSCPTCNNKIADQIDYGFNLAGGLGIFFAFTEVSGRVRLEMLSNLLSPLSRPRPDAPLAVVVSLVPPEQSGTRVCDVAPLSAGRACFRPPGPHPAQDDVRNRLE